MRNDKLQGMCERKKRENEYLISMCHNLLDILNGLIKEETVLSEQIEPIIEQGQYVLGTLTRTDNGFNKILYLDNSLLMNDDNIENIEQSIEYKRELLLTLRDFDSLDVLMESFICDSRRIMEDCCKQKGLNGKCNFDFDLFLQEYKGFSPSINFELIPALEKTIQYLSDYIESVPMACIYAPPEMMVKPKYIFLSDEKIF